MERTPQRRITFIHLPLEPTCKTLSLVDRALVTVQEPRFTITAKEFAA